ncbi:MAG: DUF2231 domain-containing protein [Beijerinckiaceae bacterium]
MSYAQARRAEYAPRFLLHPYIVPLPLACFAGALVTDICYVQTSTIQWANFSAWLLAVGLAFGILAAAAGLVDLFRTPSRQRPAIVWLHAAGGLFVLLIVLVNNFVHARDGWTSVMPLGITLSAVTVLFSFGLVYFGVRVARHVRYGVVQ